MTTSATSPEGRESENAGDAAGEGGSTEKSENRGPVIFATLAAVVGGAGSLIGFLIGFRDNVTSIFGTVGCVILIYGGDRAWRFIKSGKLTKTTVAWFAGVAALSVCATVVIVGLTEASGGSAVQADVTATVRVTSPTYPQLGIAATHFGCPQAIFGTDSIPRGYTIAVGFKLGLKGIWVLQPAIDKAGRWRIPRLYIPQYPGSGTEAYVTAVVLKVSTMEYYIDSSQQISRSPGLNLWESTDLPAVLNKTPFLAVVLPTVEQRKKSACWSPQV